MCLGHDCLFDGVAKLDFGVMVLEDLFDFEGVLVSGEGLEGFA